MVQKEYDYHRFEIDDGLFNDKLRTGAYNLD
jgi:hypothetical protein